tara:strand:+ start:2766 stop:3926 length:1161 start_codon:yes stop_codon:yes gene_type:complete
MSDSNTIRVLSLDGGGMRGYYSLHWMKLFIDEWGINPNDIWKYFDVITGSSIGGITALAYAMGKSPEELFTFFEDAGPWIFSTSDTTPSDKVSEVEKVNVFINPLARDTFYRNDNDLIGNRKLLLTMQDTFGTTKLSDLKTKVVITSFKQNNVSVTYTPGDNSPVYFSNSTIVPGLIGADLMAADIGMATSAAPLYFEPHDIDDSLYIDGGVVQNNPSSFALTIGKAKKPACNRFCVLSIGTGLGNVGFDPSENALRVELSKYGADKDAYITAHNLTQDLINTHEDLHSKMQSNAEKLSPLNQFMFLTSIMTTGPQEVSAREMQILNDSTLENLHYHRAQTFLDPDMDTELDDSTPEVLQYYKDLAQTNFTNDIDNIREFIRHLRL